MKKLLSSILALTMMFAMTATAFATENNPKAVELTDEVFLSMTLNDFNNCYDYLLHSLFFVVGY